MLTVENWSTWRKTCLSTTLSTQIPLDKAREWTHMSVVKDQWLPEIWHGQKSLTLPACEAGVEVSGQTFWLLYLYVKRPLVLTWGEGVTAPQPLWTLMGGEKFLVPAKNWRPVCVLVTLPTELSWLTLSCISYIDKHPSYSSSLTIRQYLTCPVQKGSALHWLCLKLPHRKQKKFKQTVLTFVSG